MNDNDAWRRVSTKVSPKKRRMRFWRGESSPFFARFHLKTRDSSHLLKET